MARLLIQPLVENAFIHGLELKNGLKWIMITCSVNGETLYVEAKGQRAGNRGGTAERASPGISWILPRRKLERRKVDGKWEKHWSKECE